jgi:hypothetical protein
MGPQFPYRVRAPIPHPIVECHREDQRRQQAGNPSGAQIAYFTPDF